MRGGLKYGIERRFLNFALVLWDAHGADAFGAMLGTYFDQKLAKWRSFEDGGVRKRFFLFLTQFQGKLVLT